MITKDLLKEAFRKLLTYSYFDKTDMVMRSRVAEFDKGGLFGGGRGCLRRIAFYA